MTRRAHRIWKLLFAAFAACAVGGVAAWGILLTSFCADPRAPVQETQHVIAYNCHGMTVFISPLEIAMRDWLLPLEAIFIVLSVIAGAMVLLGAAKLRIAVRIERSPETGRSRDGR